MRFTEVLLPSFRICIAEDTDTYKLPGALCLYEDIKHVL